MALSAGRGPRPPRASRCQPVADFSQRTFYDGSSLRHTHTYINAYVSFGQGWDSRETKGCPRH